MSVNRTNEIDSIIGNLALAVNDKKLKQTTLLSGGFGTGKSWLLGNVEKELQEKNLVHSMLKCDVYKDIAFVPDFAAELTKNIRLYGGPSGSFENRETSYVHTKFFENLIKIKETDFESFNLIIKRIIFKSMSDKVLEEYNNRRHPDTVDIRAVYDRFFEKKTDRELMKNIGEYVAEALIVDIMNHFFKLGGSYPNYEAYLDTELPKKVLIVADDIDPIAGSAFKWLLEVFIPYCNTKSFHQFISYDFQGGRSNIKVSDFLDFRFLLSARQDITRPGAIVAPQIIELSTEKIELLPFTVEETSEFTGSYHLPEPVDAAQAQELTSGIPYVIALWLESKSYANNNFDNFILPLVIDKIFRYSADYEIEWIKSAAFLDSIDGESLHCFPAFDGSAEKAAWFFGQMDSLTTGTTDGQAAIDPILKKYILQSVLQSSAAQYEEFLSISQTVKTQKELLLPFGDKEKKLVMELAWYNRFDGEFVPEFAFGDESPDVKRIIADYPQFFTANGSHLSFKPEVHSQLMKYNLLTGRELASSKEEEVKKCWDDYVGFLNKNNEEIDSETVSLKAQLETEDKVHREKKQEYSDLQVRFMRDENEMIELRVTIADYSINKTLYTTISNFSLGIILAVVGFFIPDIFADSPQISSIEMIQTVLYCVAGLFGIAGIVFLIRMFFSNSKVEYEKLNSLYTSKTKQKEEKEQEMMEKRTVLDALELKVKNLGDRLEELEKQKKLNLARLEEPFCQ